MSQKSVSKYRTYSFDSSFRLQVSLKYMWKWMIKLDFCYPIRLLFKIITYAIDRLQKDKMTNLQFWKGNWIVLILSWPEHSWVSLKTSMKATTNFNLPFFWNWIVKIETEKGNLCKERFFLTNFSKQNFRSWMLFFFATT